MTLQMNADDCYIHFGAIFFVISCIWTVRLLQQQHQQAVTVVIATISVEIVIERLNSLFVICMFFFCLLNSSIVFPSMCSGFHTKLNIVIRFEMRLQNAREYKLFPQIVYKIMVYTQHSTASFWYQCCCARAFVHIYSTRVCMYVNIMNKKKKVSVKRAKAHIIIGRN